MIQDADIDFHPTDPDQHDWAETNYFAFFNAELGICGHLQALFRPNLGVVMTDVRIWRGLVNRSWDALYVANHHHQPMSKSLRRYTLPSGLSVEALSVRDYRVDYLGTDETEIHFDVRGIMPPYDIADPEMDPVTRRQMDGGFVLGEAYRGHWDMHARVTGEIRCRGETFPIDCVQVMDHSWGPRTETELPAMMWLGSYFPERDLAVHAFFPADPAASDTLSLAHGYICEGGKVTGLTGGQLKLTRLEYQPIAGIWEVEDADGRRLTLYGAAIAGGPWPVYPSVDVGISLMRWTLGGDVGHGLAMENSAMAYRVRHGAAARG
ncbi:DUF7065 domain-containing protein [Sphingomonas sp. ID0503]|uniref:DUF7065 domain-containing protein n=1 Tax=Sphingomonas sp. ID0503 TaxID=3399691 RepID=UPI003AFAF6ED